MNADDKRIGVFLLDDHELVRRGLREFLEEEGDIEIVAEAATAREALEKVEAAAPDVAVLDVRLPDGSGIEVCREIRSRLPDTRCLILTSYADDRAMFEAIVAGAAAYVLKETRASDLVEDIRRLARGETLLDTGAAQEVLERVRASGMSEPTAPLSPQEEKILDLIGEGLSNREIAQRLHLAEQTVKNYVSRLMAKLGFERRVQAALYATNRPR
ncbi:MAG: response regulator transcription factor [Actinomycetota bacterium]